GVVDVDGEKIYVTDIPAKGWKVVRGNESKGDVAVSDKKIENAYFIVEFADDYSISRIYDKRVGREVLKAGERANVIEALEDFPREYDAWEISVYYKEKKYEINDVSAVEMLDEGVRKGFKITRKFYDSVIEQKVWLYADIDKIDFDTTAEWYQEHILVKAAFPVDINADKATYEIQFGSVERPTHTNTSWDAAKFEVCAHKFADLSECDYGVSILNDCKYGHDIHDGVIKLTLLKCATHPSPKADKGHHEFIYSLRPHAGTYTQAGTVQLAYDLNNPMSAVKLGKQEGILPESYSFVSVSDENIVIDTVKKAEDSDETVVRMYESWNKRVNGAKLTFGFDVKSAVLCDLMENEIEPLAVENNSVTLNVKPYEIVTVKVK
ncbi:MAG: glycoside hydrolase family 38 C-terminal domain-containing protein, partial [Acutalibacteraceae bacterium]|nr:glycoside hydrolase family 38 C-terminal domain-containing protein [Acutalibacteraceae bacterium]